MRIAAVLLGLLVVVAVALWAGESGSAVPGAKDLAGGALGPFDVSRGIKGAGDETAAFRAIVAENRHVLIPAGFTVTISGTVPVPADTVIEGPGTIHLTARGATFSVAERCVLSGLRFTCTQGFAHGNAVTAETAAQGTVRKMDCRIAACRFERMHGGALAASEVSHLAFEDNYWENHSPNSLYYNPTLLRAVSDSRITGNTILHGNQGILFRGGRYNTVTGNHLENCLQGITCHTSGGHPEHWPYTLFAHNVIANNVIRRLREEGIAYDCSMGETPAVNAAQNQVRAVVTVKAAAAGDANRFRVTLNEAANPGKAYAKGWADHYYAGVLTGDAAGMLLEIIESGEDGGGWLDLPRLSAELPGRLKAGDRLWIAAGCFYNTLTGNVVDNAGMVSGTGNATCIGLWGSAWHNQIAGNVCTTRQYGITLGCVGLARPESPQGPCAGNIISGNTVAGSWRSPATKGEETGAGAIAFVCIGDGPLLGGRLFLGNQIVSNALSWAGRNPVRLTRDHGSYVGHNRISDAGAAITMEHTTGAVLEGNRTMAGTPVTEVRTTGSCTYRCLDQLAK